MKQKEIHLADLNPTKGSEQQGIRPVVIISGDVMNNNLDVCIVCPLSTTIKHYAGCIFLPKNNINNLSNDSEIISFHQLKYKIGASYLLNSCMLIMLHIFILLIQLIIGCYGK